MASSFCEHQYIVVMETLSFPHLTTGGQEQYQQHLESHEADQEYVTL